MTKLSIGFIAAATAFALSLSACDRDRTTSEYKDPPRTAQAPEITPPPPAQASDSATAAPEYKDPSIPPNPPENQPKDVSVPPADQK